MTFFVLWAMSTKNRHYLDFLALPTHLFQSSHILFLRVLFNFSLFKPSPFMKDLRVGCKATPIISVSRIAQCSNLKRLPQVQSLFFCFAHVFWFNIRSFWCFCRWEANWRKLFSQKRSFGLFLRQQIPAKNSVNLPQK